VAENGKIVDQLMLQATGRKRMHNAKRITKFRKKCALEKPDQYVVCEYKPRRAANCVAMRDLSQ